MFEKKTLTVRNLKMTKIFYFCLSVVLFIASFFAYNTAGKYQTNSYYYWSGSVRKSAGIFNTIGLLLLIFGAAALGIGLCIYFLEKKGKVCPKCEKVCQASEAMCPKCHTDITHAKKVKEYLLEKPTITSNTSPRNDKSK